VWTAGCMYSSFFALPGRKIRFVRGKEKSLKNTDNVTKKEKEKDQKKKNQDNNKMKRNKGKANLWLVCGWWFL